MSNSKAEHSLITIEQLLKRTSNLYEAVLAMSKEARRVNLFSQAWGQEEKPVTRALINFAGGKVEYFIEGKDGSLDVTRPPAKKRSRRVR